MTRDVKCAKMRKYRPREELGSSVFFFVFCILTKDSTIFRFSLCTERVQTRDSNRTGPNDVPDTSFLGPM